MKRILLYAGTSIFIGLVGQPSYGQEVSASASSSAEQITGVEDIIVTARRRNERVQDTPLAITAVSEQQLERARAVDLRDVAQFSPNLQIRKNAGLADTAAIYMRGFGLYTSDAIIEPPVAISIDGVYQPSIYGSLIDLFDASEVEVMRGPQGTLFGKNAATGAIAISTKRPQADRLSGNVQLDYGSYDRVEGRAALNIPIVQDTLAVRLSGTILRGGNFIKNVNPDGRDSGGNKTQSGRIGINWTPNDRLKAYVTAYYYDDKSPFVNQRSVVTGLAYPPYMPAVSRICTVYGVCSPFSGPHTSAGSRTVDSHVKRLDVTANIDYEFDPVILSSVSGYKKYKGFSAGDVDGTPFPVLTVTGTNQNFTAKSQELRMASRKDGGLDLDGRIDWVVGAYFFDQHYDNVIRSAILGSAPTINASEGNMKSFAIFGHVIFNVNDKWNISFGDRQTWDKKDHTFQPPNVLVPLFEKAKFKKNTLEVGTQYKFSPTKMIYARYAQGYRGGGFVSNPGSILAAARFEPESVDTYEAGIKTDWLGNKLRLNLTAFRSEYKDLQRSIITLVTTQNGGSATTTKTQNAASARIQGIEFEAMAVPIRNLTLRASLGYLDANFAKYVAILYGAGPAIDHSDNLTFTYAPKWTANFGADYEFELGGNGSLSLGGNVDYRSTHYIGPNDYRNDFFREDGYALVNVSAKWTDPSEKFSVMLYGNNIFDKLYRVQSSHSSGLSMQVIEGAPDTWGVRLIAGF